MKKFAAFLRKERLYILLLIFVIEVNVIVLLHDAGDNAKAAKTVKVSASQMMELQKTTKMKEAKVEKILEDNKSLRALFTIASLIILLVLFLGLSIDLILLVMRLAKKKISILTHRLPKAKWSLWDVCRVVILFAFFGYMLVLIESALVKTFPIVKNDNFRMVINSSILDTLVVVFILYFTVRKYKTKLIALGISSKNISRNIFYGIIGYIAVAPILLTTLIVISVVMNFMHYAPKEQAVVRLFMKEEDGGFLLYTVIFASLIGPIIEELFFRGFMYNALKKYIGIFWAAVGTASIFAMLHTYAVGFIPILLLGLLLAYLYEKTGTLVAPMTVHMIHNTSMVLLVLLVKQIRI